MKSSRLKETLFELPTYLIDHPQAVEDALEQISKAREIALDTESNSLYVYQERTCVIQISTGKRIYIFDPVRISEMSPLNAVTANPKIVKYIHGADYDVGGLKRDFRLEFNNIFDTMIAAQFLNYPKIGMADLVEHYLDVHLEKKFTKSNWSERPISMQKMVYLVQDVQYLIEVGRELKNELKGANLYEEAEVEFRRLEARPPVDMARNVHNFWHVKGVRGLKPRPQSIMYELYQWREKRAERINIPPFKVLNNKTMIEIAQQAPPGKRQLMHIKGITETVYNRCGRDILRCVQKGASANPDRIPPREKKRNRRGVHWDDQALVDALKKWRLEAGEERNIHHLAVLPGYALEAVARSKPTTILELEAVEGVGKKRAALYGEHILGILQAQKNQKPQKKGKRPPRT